MDALRYKPSAFWRLDDSTPYQDYSGYNASGVGSGTERKGIALTNDATYSQVFDSANIGTFASPAYRAGFERSTFSLAATVRPIIRSTGYTAQPYRENLIIAPSATSFTNLLSIGNSSGTMTYVSATETPSGRYVRETWNGVTAGSMGFGYNSITVQPGTYSISYWVRTNKSTFQNYSGESISGETNSNFVVTVTPDTWTKVSFVSEATQAGVYKCGGFISTTTAGDYLDISSPICEKGSVGGSYFDGNFPGFEWSGAANNSISRTRSDVSAVNLARNPRMNSVNSTTANANNGTLTRSVVTDETGTFVRYISPAGSALASYKIALTAVGDFTTVNVGDEVRIGFEYRLGGNWTAAQVRVCNPAATSTGLGSYAGNLLASPTEWKKYSGSRTATGTPQASEGIYISLPGMATTLDSWIDVRAVFVIPNNATQEYFDGSLPSAEWSGTPDLSWSYMRPSNGPVQILGNLNQTDGLSVNGTKVSFSTKYANTGEAKCTYDVGVLQKLDLVGVHTDKKNSLYVNGVLVAEVDISDVQQADTFASTNNNLYSGYSQSSRGLLANNYGIYMRPISSEEVKRMFDANNRRVEGSVPKQYKGDDIFLSTAVRPLFLDTGWNNDEDWQAASLNNVVADGGQLTATMSQGLTLEGTWMDSVELYAGTEPVVINSVNMWWEGVNETVEASVDGDTWVPVVKGENLSIIPTGFDPTDKALFIRVSFPAGQTEAFIDSMQVNGYLSNTAVSNKRNITYNNPVVVFDEQVPGMLRDDWGVKINPGGSITISGVDPEDMVRTNLFKTPSAENGATGMRGTRVALSIATDWAASGTQSFRLTKNEEASTDAFMEAIDQISTSGTNAGALKPNTRYTIMGTYRLNTLIPGIAENYTGINLNQKLSIFVHLNGGTTAVAFAGRNTLGVATIRGFFTTPPSLTGYNTLRFYNGGANGSAVEWDSLLLVEGEYTGDYFDGDTVDPEAAYSWTGTPHASTSVKIPTGYTPLRTLELWVRPDVDFSATFGLTATSTYQNGYGASSTLKAGDWVVYHRVLTDNYTGDLTIDVPGQIGKVAFYDTALTGAQVASIVASYTGIEKINQNGTGVIAIAESPTPVSIYQHDWETLGY